MGLISKRELGLEKGLDFANEITLVLCLVQSLFQSIVPFFPVPTGRPLPGGGVDEFDFSGRETTTGPRHHPTVGMIQNRHVSNCARNSGNRLRPQEDF